MEVEETKEEEQGEIDKEEESSLEVETAVEENVLVECEVTDSDGCVSEAWVEFPAWAACDDGDDDGVMGGGLVWAAGDCLSFLRCRCEA